MFDTDKHYLALNILSLMYIQMNTLSYTDGKNAEFQEQNDNNKYPWKLLNQWNETHIKIQNEINFEIYFEKSVENGCCDIMYDITLYSINEILPFPSALRHVGLPAVSSLGTLEGAIG